MDAGLLGLAAGITLALTVVMNTTPAETANVSPNNTIYETLEGIGIANELPFLEDIGHP